ncbi:hypothetical protein M413DRAFT_420490 [Hebeloma cylindrosporum]|uniref:NACHT domain-containing protein n=1 Tax=Hebeloma cylindrosporum TaxID=76867 RepID=A0A0C2YBG9_HEBCY|nr:hypothetical protein M413DRAFT_420490 [Hebeloma cylindrosporum h7]
MIEDPDNIGIVFIIFSTIMRFLSAIELNGLAYADGGAGYNTTKQCLVGTRIEILDEIEQWAHSTEPNVPPVFWINGAAGTGKSAIAHTLALRFHQRNELGSFLSFDRTYLAERRHEKVFSTVARDLASHNPGVRRPLAAVIRERNWLKRTADIIQQWESLVITPSAHLPTDHPILLVIDALDESGDIQSRKHLLSILAHRAVELPSNVRILLTSRPLDDILQALQSSIHVISKVIDDLPKSSINRDIRSYISARLTQVNGFVFDDNRLQILVNHSEGLFQWAFVACEFIQGSGRLFSPEKRYHKLTNPSNTASLTKLDMLYDTILQEVCPDNDEDDMQVFCSVMGQILASFEPLPLDALTVIRAQFPSRAVDADDVYSVLKHMGSVLSGITNHSIPIRPLHSSFRDYLTDPRRSRNFYIDISQHSSDLAFAMLQIMDTGLHFNISSLENSYLLNSEVFNLAQKVEQSISTPLSYSCRHWASHVQATPFDSKIATQVRKFLNQQFLYWMEVLSLVKSVHIVAHSMSLIINWINVCYKDILDFAVDAQKFVGVFGGVISQSTPHLYLSALPFAPANSIIYRKFSPKFPHAAKVVSGQMTSWPRCQNIWHTPGVACIVFSPDGKHIISGSENGTISIWDAEIGEIVTGPLKEHTEQVNAIGISPDGKYIISGSRDKTICIWDAKTGDAMIAPLKGHTGSVLSVIFSPDGKHIISCSNDHTIRIWDAKTGKVVNGPLKGHTNPVTCVAFSQDGKHIMSSAWDKTIRIWDAETGAVMSGPFTLYTDCVLSAAFSPDGKYIITGSKDKTICMWDAKTGEAIGVPLKGHTDCVTSIVFLQDNKHIITGSWHTGYFTFPAVSPDNKHIIAGSDEHRTISIWDVQTGQYVPVLLKGQPDQIESVAFLPDGHIISGSYNNRICIWNAEINELVATHQSDISKDGWILGPQGRRLLWVPHVHLPDLYYPRTKYLIGQVGTQLDLSHFSHGPLWQSCGSL